MHKRLIAALGGLIAAGAALTACNGFSPTSNGVPLAELDQSGPAPTGLALAGPDRVTITRGDHLAITVEGSEHVTDALRFDLRDGKLTIDRKRGSLHEDLPGTATIHVVMPPARSLTMAGSGVIEADALNEQSAQISIAGSGSIDTPRIATQELNVSIGGSGRYRAGGTAAVLKLQLAGSGNAVLDTLHAGQATVHIAGSGGTGFASDGTVEANIVGSGMVRVSGRAQCTAHTVGSGRLVCEGPVPAA